MTDTVNAPERDDELLPCPFCGGEPRYFIDHTTELCNSVWCRACDFGVFDPNGTGSSVAAWNRRTHCDELVAAAYLDAGWRIEQCLWSYHWYLDGESVDPEDLSRGILKRTPDNARTALTARDERMKAEGAKEEREKWQRPTRDTFDAMCAMRDAINEHVPMPSLESDLLHGPENSVFCATVAESVIDAQKKAQAKITRLTEALDLAGPIALKDFDSHPFVLNAEERRKVETIRAALQEDDDE